METHPYFKILGRLSQDHIPYCVIGLMGASFYGSTLSTYDLDLFVKPEASVISKLRKRLAKEGLGEVAVLRGEVLKPIPSAEEILRKKITLIFTDPYGLSLDILTCIDGPSFDAVWNSRKIFIVGRSKINVATLEDIILSKASAGRKKDILHLKRLKDIL